MYFIVNRDTISFFVYSFICLFVCLFYVLCNCKHVNFECLTDNLVNEKEINMIMYT